MAYEMKAGQGSAFKNDKKTEDWHPAYRGKVMLPNGDVHWLDINPKKTAAGDTWISVRVGKQIESANPKPLDKHNADKANGFVSDAEDLPF